MALYKLCYSKVIRTNSAICWGHVPTPYSVGLNDTYGFYQPVMPPPLPPPKNIYFCCHETELDPGVNNYFKRKLKQDMIYM